MTLETEYYKEIEKLDKKLSKSNPISEKENPKGMTLISGVEYASKIAKLRKQKKEENSHYLDQYLSDEEFNPEYPEENDMTKKSNPHYSNTASEVVKKFKQLSKNIEDIEEKITSGSMSDSDYENYKTALENLDECQKQLTGNSFSKSNPTSSSKDKILTQINSVKSKIEKIEKEYKKGDDLTKTKYYDLRELLKQFEYELKSLFPVKGNPNKGNPAMKSRTMIHSATGKKFKVIQWIMTVNHWEYYVIDSKSNEGDVKLCFVMGYENELGDCFIPEILKYKKVVAEGNQLMELAPPVGFSWVTENKASGVKKSGNTYKKEFKEAFKEEFKNKKSSNPKSIKRTPSEFFILNEIKTHGSFIDSYNAFRQSLKSLYFSRTIKGKGVIVNASFSNVKNVEWIMA